MNSNECPYCFNELGTNTAYCEYCAAHDEAQRGDDSDDGFYPPPDEIGS